MRIHAQLFGRFVAKDDPRLKEKQRAGFLLRVDAYDPQAFYMAEVTAGPKRFNCSGADIPHRARFAAAAPGQPCSPAKPIIKAARGVFLGALQPLY